MPPLEICLWPELDAAVSTERVDQRKDAAAPDRWITRTDNPTLTVYRAQPTGRPGAAAVVCPGGGYGGVALDKEGHNPAKWLASIGITAGALKYRMPNREATGNPLPLVDIQRALQLMRNNAGAWSIDPHKVGIMGFSAGGHAAGMACTLLEPQTDRPDFAVLIYPVISMREGITHTGSRQNLLGEAPTDEQIQSYSLDERVTPANPPTFFVHAVNDHVICANSQRMHAALQQACVQSELYLLPDGGHGFGLGVNGGVPTTWPSKCEEWLKRVGVVK